MTPERGARAADDYRTAEDHKRAPRSTHYQGRRCALARIPGDGPGVDRFVKLNEVERNVVEAYKAGMAIKDIANRSGCTPMLVRTMLGRAGVLGNRRGRPWPYDAETEGALAADYGAGASMAQLIARYGGSNRTIHHVLEHKGVHIRSRGRRSKAELAALAA